MMDHRPEREDEGSIADQGGDLGDIQSLISLGATHELDLVRRWCGLESRGLFRFAHTSVDGLRRALEGRFDRISDPKCISITLDSMGAYIAEHVLYGFSFPTSAKADRTSKSSVLQLFIKRVALLAEELVKDIESGQRLFVFRPERNGSIDDCYLLLHELGRYGRSSLLWILDADRVAQVGTAFTKYDGLFIGYVDGPAYVSRKSALQPWLSACRHAIELWKRPRLSSEPEAFVESERAIERLRNERRRPSIAGGVSTD
jgi:hypothetical protein